MRKPASALLLGAVLLAGCGSSTSTGSSSGASSTAATTTAQTPAALPPAVDQLSAAERPTAGLFPSARGRTLRQLATTVHRAAQIGPATGTFTPGTGRFAFALTTSSGAFIYAPTAIYIARSPDARASGPYLAPADPLTVPRQYRSRQNAGPGGIQAIFAAQVPLPRPGNYTVLALTRTTQGLIGAPGVNAIAVARTSPIPAVGQPAPRIVTDTAKSVSGKTSLLTTRLPPESMASVSLRDAVGHRPVALLFSTPQLCTSRVCGPVTDIAVELQHRFGSRIAFIHQEVYVDNQPTKGLRPQLMAFHLRTEPWLFTINRRGVIVARLEGSFGINAVTHAIEAALR